MTPHRQSVVQKILRKSEEIKNRNSGKDHVSDIPDSSENTDTTHDSIDAHDYQSGLIENLREGHITGTGGSVKGASEDDLTKEEMNTVEKYERMNDKNTFGEMITGNPLFLPVAGAMRANQVALQNPFSGAVSYGGLGALAGMGLNRLRKKRNRKKWLPILLGAGGALTGGALAKSSSVKKAFDPMFIIQTKIQSDPSLNTVQQEELINAAKLLDETEKLTLADILTTVAGAGVGAAIAKFLAKAGKLGTVAGGLAGGLLGSRLGSVPKNIPGTINNEVDFFGRRF